MSLFTIAKLQLCREEREKIIREEALNQPTSMSTRLSEPRKRSYQTSRIVSNTPASRFQSHPLFMTVLNRDGILIADFHRSGLNFFCLSLESLYRPNSILPIHFSMASINPQRSVAFRHVLTQPVP